ncbi:hypothetical protein M407DRAFT_33855 [Tulasnella calospora MUT 4182]|uniref:F-box domain-containing protein n=1 Tax=Tulasnella calospora MUT 4182 TaxID=1051891 RepID=A0A0C3Q1M8_9AGAM|nr:hypothetical protein M407DRAFT_33855 [Tulasnella calospora MUT 4182]
MIESTHSGLEPRAAHRVLFIIEILMQVLRNLGKPELAAAALTCRTWTDVALDMLWEELESVCPIMALLGPISKHENGWDWDSGFPSGDWTRFSSYVKRVRSLSYCSADENGGIFFSGQMSSGVPARWLHYVASHSGQYLLPQIRKIDWNCCEDNELEMILPFLSSKIKDIRIRTWWDVSPTAMDRILKALRGVLPSGVRVFHFIPHGFRPTEGASEHMGPLIEPLNELQDLRVPYHLMAPAMFKPSQLRALEGGCDLESGINANALLSQLADTCPLLEDLRIMFWGGSNIDFSVIRPLIRCSKLRSLDMEYERAFDPSPAEIREMGRAWRELEALHIASRRVYNDPALGMPVGLLVAFAESFSPKLRKLGLYVYTHDIPAPPDPPVSFPNLEVIYFGTSELDSDKAKVAKAFVFLSGLLPKKVGPTTSHRWSWETERSVFDPGSRGWGGDSWNVLSRMLSQGETADILAELDPVPQALPRDLEEFDWTGGSGEEFDWTGGGDEEFVVD